MVDNISPTSFEDDKTLADFHNTKVVCTKHDINDNLFVVDQQYTLVRGAPKASKKQGLKQYKIDKNEWICVSAIQGKESVTQDVVLWTVSYVYERRDKIRTLLGCIGKKKIKWLTNAAKELKSTKVGTVFSYSAALK